MKSETLQLVGTLDETTSTNVTRLLSTVNGVNKVAFSTATGSVNVDFNEGVTSRQELSTVLQRSGFGVKKAAHGEDGSCCGSCGG